MVQQNNYWNDITLNDCEKLAYMCHLKIEPPNNADLIEAEIDGLTEPKYVLKYRNPTYEMKTFDDLYNLHLYLNFYLEEFKRRNEEFVNKREEEWNSEFANGID